MSFEWDYVNVLTLLRLAGIPRYAAERIARHPLIVVGGAVTFVNPEPLALFADVIAAGEGEVLVPGLRRAFAAATDRDDLLRLLAAERGFYIPSFYEPQYAADGTLAGLRGAPGVDAPMPVRKAALQDDRGGRSAGDQHLHARHRVRLALPRSKSSAAAPTCAGSAGPATTTCRSARFRPIASSSWREAARVHSSRVGLVSIALCDHPDIERILARLLEMGYAISPASLRLDDLTESIVRVAARRAASGRSPSRRKPDPIACAA